MSKLIKFGSFIGVFVVVLAFTTSTYAVNDNASEKAQTNQQYKQYKVAGVKEIEKSTDGSKSAREKGLAMKEVTNSISTAGAMKKIKLSEARLKVCKVKENAIENRFKTLLALGVKTHTGKDKIIERVDNFYNDVLVPAGYTLPNYDILKADITTKEANVKTILDSAQTTGESFSCDSDDPKTQTDQFKSDIQKLITANKEYRTSVRNFVVAVRDLAKKAKADKISPSPVVSPVVSPVISPVTSPTATPVVTATP